MQASDRPERPGGCPSDGQLAQFAGGALPVAEIEQLAQHLTHCPSCQSRLEALDGAKPGGRVIPPAYPLPFAEESQCGQVVEQLQHLKLPSHVSPLQAVAPKAAKPPRRRLGDYQLLQQLGQGGMGTVYKARHATLGTTAAVKVLTDRRMADEQAIRRFEREMEAIGRLDHPNIVRAIDAGEEHGVHFLVMEYVEGIDLSCLVRRGGPMRVADACEAVRQAADGLEHVHRHGRIHRDIKPSNLMLSVDGTVKILDLGLARFGQGLPEDETSLSADGDHFPNSPSPELTFTNHIMGTLEYMAPEQSIDSREVDGRSDIYSLGCTLFKLLTGRAPFGDPQYSTSVKQMMAHAHTPPPPVRQFRFDVPDELEAVLGRMLAKKPDDRFARSADVAAALEKFAVGADLAGLAGQASIDLDRDTADRAGLTIASPAPQRRSTIAGKRAGRSNALPLWLLAGGAVLMMTIAGIVGAVLLVAYAGRPTLIVLEADDSEVARAVQAGHIRLRNAESSHTSKLVMGSNWVPPGEYTIEVIDDSPLRIDVEHLTINKGDRRLLRPAMAAGKASVAREAPVLPVDLLALIDPQRDALAESWRFDEGALVSNAQGRADLQIPYAPPTEYRVEATVERIAGADALLMGLVIDGRQFCVVLDGWPHEGNLSGPHTIDGQGLELSERPYRGIVLPAGKAFDISYTVQAAGGRWLVKVEIDGRELFGWRGESHRLDVESFRRPPVADVLWLNSTDTQWRVTRLRAVPLGGAGRVDEFADPARHPDLAAAQRVLWKGGEVEISRGQSEARITVSNWSAARKQFDAAAPWRLHGVNLANNRWLSPADVELLDRLAHLESLDLSDTPVDDRAFSALRDLRRLQSLDMSRSQVTGESLTSLWRFGNLKHIALVGLPIDDVAMDKLTALAQLESLDLRYTAATDGGLQNAGNWRRLRRLDLSHTGVTERGIESLASLPVLEELAIMGAPLSNGAAEDLAKIQSLRRLLVVGSGLDEEGVGRLRGALPECRIVSGLEDEIDLLALIDPQWVPLNRGWRMSAKGVVSSPLRPARMLVPLRPPREYDIEMVARRISGNDGVGLVVHAGGRPVLVEWDHHPASGPWTLIDMLDGLRGWDNVNGRENESKVRGATFLAGGEPVRVLVRVRGDGIVVEQDGKTVIDWQGDFSRIGLLDMWQPPVPNCLMFGSWEGEVEFQKLTLRPLSGPARLVEMLPTAASDERDVAQWVRQHDGTVAVTTDGKAESWIQPGAPLPAAPLWVRRIRRMNGAEVDAKQFEQLASLRQLIDLDLSHTRYDEADLEKLADLGLEVLWLMDSPLTDRGAQIVGRFGTLERLHLERTAVSDRGVAELVDLRGLIELRLEHTSVTDYAVPLLKELPKLFWLGLDGTGVTGEGLRELGDMNEISILYLNDMPIGDDDVAFLARLPKLRQVFLSNTNVGDGAADTLSRLPRLDDLRLSNTQLDDEGLAKLVALRALKTLHLDGTRVTDASLAILPELTALTELRLENTAISDAAILHLAALSNLKQLNLSGTQITSDGVERLRSALPGCQIEAPSRELRLSGQDITDDDLAALLDDAPPLEGLFLAGAKITSASLPRIAQMKMLRILQLENTPIADEDLAHLSALTALEELNLNGTAVTDEGLAHLAPLTSLKYLRLGRTAVTGTGFEHLEGLTELRLVQLGSAPVTPEGFKRLVALRRLASLDVAGASIADDDLPPLAEMKNLHFVHLGYTKVRGPGLVHLQNATNLNNLILTRSPIDNDALRHLSALTGLEALELNETAIGDEGLAHLSSLVGLRRLNLAETNISDEGLKSLASLTALRELHLERTSVSTEGLRPLLVALPLCVVHADVPIPQVQRNDLAAKVVVDGSSADAPRDPELPLPPPKVLSAPAPRRERWIENGAKLNWSPDGQFAVYSRTPGAGLVRRSLKTGEETVLSKGGIDANISPDGKQIAFLDGNKEIWLIDADGGQRRRLTDDGDFPFWTVDGRRVVCFSHKLEKLVSLDVQAAKPQSELYYAKEPGTYCDRSPDGRRLTFFRDGHLVVVERADDKVVARWPLSDEAGVLPAFSPDGRYVAFGGFNLSRLGLWVLDTESGSAARLYEGQYTMPAFSPDGKTLAFDGRASNDQAIWRVPIAAWLSETFEK